MTNKTYDIAVCGGGFAGVSAALAAARQGKKVILFEKQYILGGLGTAGLVTIYLPICDGLGRQVCYGIAEELLRLSITYGAEGKYPANWLDGIGTRTEADRRFEVQYNAHVCAILMEKLLLENGVDIAYGSYVTGVELSEGRITALRVNDKSGETLYETGTVVDATGDCDIARFAGAPATTYKQGNILAAWYYSSGADGYRLRMLGVAELPDEEKNGEDTPPLVNRRFTGLDGREISEMTALSHEQILKHWLKDRESGEGEVIATIPSIPQLRMTAKITGEYELRYDDAHRSFPDSVGMIPNWKERGPVYEVPFGTLYNRAVKNLAVAGRCVSTDERLWDVMRVIPCCAVTGQAAGTAAALTDDFTAIDIDLLQKTLQKSGVILHEKDL